MALNACLDTRFYFAHYSQEAPFWTKRVVAECRQAGSRVVSSTVTITELVSSMTQEVGLDSVRLRIDSAKQAGVRLIPPSEEIAFRAGEIVLKNRETPMADAIIAATAIVHAEGRVYTDDPHFDQISGIRVLWGRA